jgi:hypothetical protein
MIVSVRLALNNAPLASAQRITDSVRHTATLEVLRSCFNRTEGIERFPVFSSYNLDVDHASDPVMVTIPDDVPAFTSLAGIGETLYAGDWAHIIMM